MHADSPATATVGKEMSVRQTTKRQLRLWIFGNDNREYRFNEFWMEDNCQNYQRQFNASPARKYQGGRSPIPLVTHAWF